MMKQIVNLLLGLIAVTMVSCSGDSFKVKAVISGLGNQNVRIVYMGANGVVDTYITADDGKFEVEGSTAEPTVMTILDLQNSLMCRLAVAGGDKIELKGDYNNPHHYSCKGSDVAQQWLEFEEKNALLYDQADRTPLDRAIEKFVKDNPESLVSTMLLVVDYSDATKAIALLEKLDVKLRPASLCESLERLKDATTRTPDRMMSMNLCAISGDFESLTAAQTGYTLVYLWNDNRNNRRDDINALKAMGKKWGNRLTITDVSLMPDSIGWRPILKNDTTTWRHYWAPGSILDPAVKPLNITTLPLTVVTDSTGHIIYHGTDLTAASSALAAHLK